MKHVSSTDLFPVHSYKLHGCKCVRGTKTPAKYSRQKQQDDEDPTEWDGNYTHGTDAKRYRHQHIGIKTVGKIAND